MITVTHRRYVPYSHAHYAGNLVDGAYALGLFGDVATEVCIRLDGDEGLFASYADVQFKAPVQAGDVLEVTAHGDPDGHPVADHRLRRGGGVPGHRRLGRAGAARADRRGDRHGHGGRARRETP